ncbi:MAG: LamG-like jellyroll fold domain-containing protein [Halapricum sp.]
MTDVRAATESLLEDKPDLEGQLEDLLSVDADHETWTFDDIPLDSGTFGELVSQGIVERADGEYRLRDRRAVEAALNPDAVADDDSESGASPSLLTDLSVSAPEVDRVTAIGLAGALALVVLFRLLPYPSVFQNGDVVLSGNDPYAYRYLVHQLLADSGGILDLSTLSELPDGIAHGEPLLVATLWWVSALFGGAADVVLAWYPVVSAVVTALVVYVLTVRVTADRRAGIAAVALLAIMPGHAFRTGLGFADHHAFDYPWLALTALAVVGLADRDVRDRATWGWALALGVGVGGQTLAWDAGPLLLVPLAAYVVLVVPSWVRAGRSPLREGAGLAVGLGVGAALVAGGHHLFGWHSTEVAATPALLLAGTGGVLALGAVARRFEVGVRPVVAAEVGGLIAGVFVIRTLLPSLSAQLMDGIDFLLTTEGIAETTSIVSGRVGSLVGPVFLFGFALFLAVPYLAWASWRCYRRHEPELLAVSAYAWVFLVLGIVQARFAGQLALFVAVFGGLGFVHLAAWVDLTEYPELFGDVGGSQGPSSRPDESSERAGPDDLEWPERREALYTAGLGLGVGSLGAVMTPIKHAQLTIDDAMYEAAAFMREYADEQGWEYPDDYVFSRWGRNRVYNWFVNGESRSYGYAQSNFEDFVTSTDGGEWYERLRDRVGFVVVGDELPIDAGGETIYERLWSENLGIETDHYRAVWTSADDSRRVYTLVPGAQVTGPAPDGETVAIEGDVEVSENPLQITHDMNTSHGVYHETIPLPGRYDVGSRSVDVSVSDVRKGRLISDFEHDATAYWSFEEGSGEWAYDRAGGRHARLSDVQWVDGVDGSAIELSGDGSLRAPTIGDHTVSEFTISAWIRPETEASGGILSFGKDGGSNSTHGILFDHGLSGWNNDRLGVYVGDGDSSYHATSPHLGLSYPATEFHHVAVVFDSGTVRWVLDGAVLAERSVSATTVSFDDDAMTYIGREYSGHGGLNRFQGRIDDLRYDETALSVEDIYPN